MSENMKNRSTKVNKLVNEWLERHSEDVVDLTENIDEDDVNTIQKTNKDIDIMDLEIHRSVNKQCIQQSKPYTDKEDKMLIDYIRKNRLEGHVKGTLIWKEMADKQVLKNRTWQSLQSRFKQKLLNERGCRKYLTDDEMKDFIDRIEYVRKEKKQKNLKKLENLPPYISKPSSSKTTVDNESTPKKKKRKLFVMGDEDDIMDSNETEANQAPQKIVINESESETETDDRRNFIDNDETYFSDTENRLIELNDVDIKEEICSQTSTDCLNALVKKLIPEYNENDVIDTTPDCNVTQTQTIQNELSSPVLSIRLSAGFSLNQNNTEQQHQHNDIEYLKNLENLLDMITSTYDFYQQQNIPNKEKNIVDALKPHLNFYRQIKKK